MTIPSLPDISHSDGGTTWEASAEAYDGANMMRALRLSMLGLKHNVNLLVDYDERWPLAFADERSRIVSALGCIAKGIEHYGSTAVVGMRAKPIIDILVGVEPFDDWAKCREPLERGCPKRCVSRFL